MQFFPVIRYRIFFQVITAICFTDYAGSALRGALGHALKNIACLTAARNRGVCQCQPDQCIYRQLFDPAKKILSNQRQQDIAPPLIIEACQQPQHMAAGEQGYFDMILIGHLAQQQLAIIQLAWQRALHDGIGIKNGLGQRGNAQLISIEVLNRPDTTPDNPGQVQLQLLSPLRLARQNKLVDTTQLDAEILLKAMIRRYALIHELHDAPIDLNYDQLKSDISAVELNTQLVWQNWVRYSNRQKQEMTLGGLVGTIQISHLSDQLWHIVYLCQWLHVGKNTVFGLGHYQLCPVSSQPFEAQSTPASHYLANTLSV